MNQIDDIKSLDLSYVLDALVAREGWSRAHAEEAIQQYRNYLILLLKNPGKTLPPSEDIDEVWHTHVLHTREYRSDCERIFGHYVDHEPASNPPLKKGGQGGFDYATAFAETQALHKHEFGDYIYEVRGWFSKLISALRKLK